MLIFSDISIIKSHLSKLKKEGNIIGFIPTMGALHNGHLSIIKKSISENNFTVVSIFVNPTQFDNSEDLKNYPCNIKNDISLSTIGETKKLPKNTQDQLKKIIEKTKSNSRMNLILALSYSGRWEIINGIKKIIEAGLPYKEINESNFKQYLNTKDVPDPELLIRTSGEYRISNFLLWQIAYSELYFTDILWPDFRGSDLIEAIKDYQKRERRFGKTTEQIHI